MLGSPQAPCLERPLSTPPSSPELRLRDLRHSRIAWGAGHRCAILRAMKAFLRAFSILHALMAALFALAAVGLVLVAGKIGFGVLAGDIDLGAAERIIEAMGVLAAAVVALQIAQTIAEEEVVRDAHVSGPTRVRRFLSRFLVVVVVALAIEALVATFRVHEDSARLLHVAAVVGAIGALLAGWGVFVHLNRSAEELEPEAMQEAKSEDRKLKQ